MASRAVKKDTAAEKSSAPAKKKTTGGAKSGTAAKKKGTAGKTSSAAVNNSSSSKRNAAVSVRGKKGTELRMEAAEPVLMKEAALWIALAVCIFLFISYFGIGGYLGSVLCDISFGVFGVLAYLLPFLLAFGTVFLLANRGSRLAAVKAAAGAVLYLTACSIVGLAQAEFNSSASVSEIYERSAAMKNGGGVVGGQLCHLLCPALGTVGAGVFFAILAVICVVLITQRSILKGVGKGGRRMYESAKESSNRRREKRMQERIRQEEEAEEFQPVPEAASQSPRVEREYVGGRTESRRRRKRRAAEGERENRQRNSSFREESTADGRQNFMDLDAPEYDGFQDRPRSRRTEIEVPDVFPSANARTRRRNHRASGITSDLTVDGAAEGTGGEVRQILGSPAEDVDQTEQRETFYIDLDRARAGRAAEKKRTPDGGEERGAKKPERRRSGLRAAGTEKEENAASGYRESPVELDLQIEGLGEEDTRFEEHPEFDADRFGALEVYREEDEGSPYSGSFPDQQGAVSGHDRGLGQQGAVSGHDRSLDQQGAVSGHDHSLDQPGAEAGQSCALEQQDAERSHSGDLEESDRSGVLTGQGTGSGVRGLRQDLSGGQDDPEEVFAEDSGEEVPAAKNAGGSGALRKNPSEHSASESGASGGGDDAERAGTQPETHAGPKRNPRSSEKEIQAGIADVEAEMAKTAEAVRPEYVFPPFDLLKKGSGKSGAGGEQEVRRTAAKLQQTLDSFGVHAKVTNVSCGPSVTRYELLPEVGVKVKQIVALSDDIKLNLAAADIRIEAPIPGKSAVGIEVPNSENSTVMLRDLLESDEFSSHKSRLAFAVGKDIGGKTVVTDIAKMPHLLIAGATGSGKSVCINTLIMSLLYKANPDEVKLIMIDPKVVELSVYNGIPHLFIPVVTDPKKAAGALNWAVAEMTDRYSKFAEYGVRDLKGYNQRVDGLKDVEDACKPKKLPQIVIIVDELADLMMVAPGEVEDSICRLAQLARAAGIHLVIATQRPSVNVITGLIKANMPSRIAFKVASSIDSRTILDMGGAEKLLGKGDMLFYPQGYQKPARVQGAFVSDEEVSDVVDFLKNRNMAGGYSAEMEAQIAQVQQAVSASHGSEDVDALFVDAGKFIIEKDKASIGMLQRVFKIGFNRAARIMDQLSEAGVVGAEEGTKPRKILMSEEEFENYLEQN